MKRFAILLIISLSAFAVNAQGVTDGLRYSTEDIHGTARFNALSGAFGALGGDFSAIAINPAGSSIYLGNSTSLSFGVNDRSNKSTYFDSRTKSTDSDINLNQAGAVFVFKNASETSNWKKFAVGVNFNTTKNYDDSIFIAGTGNTSIGDFFLDQSEGIRLDLLQLQSGESISDLYAYLGEVYGTAAQNAFLGYQGYIIDPLDPNDSNNTQYVSNIAPGSFNQKYSIREKGTNGKYTINFSTQYSDNFFFGVNLNTHLIDFYKSTYLSESNSNPGSYIEHVGFENNLSVFGSGFSAQVGGIIKVLDDTRFGITFDTPIWHVISEETTQYLESNRIENEVSILEVVNPRVLNVYKNYYLRSPGKIALSVAQVFGKHGLLSFDYSYRNYSNIQFSPTYEDYFARENTVISNTLRGASTFRIGGEYRISQLSLRGGFRFEESPYKNKRTVGDLTGFSAGLGYNIGMITMDIAYTRSEQTNLRQLYSVGLTDSAIIDSVQNNVFFTVGFNL